MNYLIFNMALTILTSLLLATTAKAMCMPALQSCVGILGAYGIWPVAFYFAMYQKKINQWTGSGYLVKCSNPSVSMALTLNICAN